MKRIFNITFATICLFTLLSFTTQQVSADSVFDKSKTNLEGTNLTAGAFVSDMTLPERIGFFLNAAYTTLGVLAIFLIVWAGSKWIFSGGDTAKIKKARDQILYAIVGLAVVLLAFLLTTYIIGRIPALKESAPASGPSAPVST